MTAITAPGPTAYPTADPLTGVITDPTATCPAGHDPTYPPGPLLPVPPPAGPPPWYQQKRYAFPLILLVLFVIIGLFGEHTTPAPPAPAPVTEPAPRPAPVAPLRTDDELAGMYYKGTFLVGSQIQPGTYSTQGPTTCCPPLSVPAMTPARLQMKETSSGPVSMVPDGAWSVRWRACRQGGAGVVIIRR